MAETEWSPRECWKYLILAFSLSWSIWIPTLFLSRYHEEFGNVLVLGAFGPSLAAILLSRNGVRISGRAMITQAVRFTSVLLVGWAILLGHQFLWDETPVSLLSAGLFLLLSAIPAGIVCTAYSSDSGVRRTMRSLVTPKGAVWQVVGLLLIPTLFYVSAAITHALGGVVHRRIVAGRGISFVHLAIVEFGYACFFGGGVTEEPGWRGFLLPRLQTRFSPLTASLLIWIPWALWHAPLDFGGYAGPTFGAYLRIRVFLLIPVCVILTFIYNRAGGSILSAVLFHSAYNVAPDFIPFAGWAIWLVIGVAVFALFSDKMWRIRRSPRGPLIPQVGRSDHVQTT